MGDISFSEDLIKLHVRKAKNDQAEEGIFIYIARTGKFTCPVALLELYIKKAALEKDSGQYVVGHLKKVGKEGWKI